jgi:uncharacterized membrane protein
VSSVVVLTFDDPEQAGRCQSKRVYQTSLSEEMEQRLRPRAAWGDRAAPETRAGPTELPERH